ncbi:MAG: hypothetical protein WEB89_10620 [Balneolales bacterium]
MKEPKTYTLHPNWKDQFTRYMIGFALLPVFGVGFLVLHSARKHLRETSYIISDENITLHEQDESISFDLVNIDQVRVVQARLEEKLNIGRIQLQAKTGTYELRGIENPERMERILRVAIATEKDRLRQKAKAKGNFPDLNAGSVDKVNTLVGLWQQGLIDDEEYERERKKI